MIAFHKNKNMLPIIRHLKDDLHIFFIPTLKRDRYYPVALWGLTVADARRRYKASEKQLEFLQVKYPDAVGDRLYIGEILSLLVQAIQENEETGCRMKTAHTTYGLIELLFGYYLTRYENVEWEVSPHEMIMIDCTEEEDVSVIEVYNLKMKDLSL